MLMVPDVGVSRGVLIPLPHPATNPLIAIPIQIPEPLVISIVEIILLCTAINPKAAIQDKKAAENVPVRGLHVQRQTQKWRQDDDKTDPGNDYPHSIIHDGTSQRIPPSPAISFSFIH